jgi:hypothetical protein
MSSPSLATFAAVLLATAAGAAQTRMLTLTSSMPLGHLGQAVGSAGDVDDDGFPDIIAGAPLATRAGALSGWAGVYSGRTGQVLYAYSGQAAEQYFGSGVSGVGDIDADGHEDFAIGATGDGTAGTRAGRLFVHSGRTGSLIFDIRGEGPGDLFGHAVARAGDVDRDGVPDFIVGAPENGDPVMNYGPGYAEVYSGRTGRVLHRFRGRDVGFEQGHAVATAGDVDRDGHADLVVSSVLESVPTSGVGAARVYSGRTGEVLHTFRGAPGADHFAMAVCGLGDVDGDGVVDIGVSAVELASLLPGNVSVFSGRTGERLRYVRAAAFSEMFGVSLCAVGDLDQDGHADFATGSAGADGGLGAALVFRGRDGSLLRRIVGQDRGAAFAFPMATAGVNQDGYADLLVGARGVAQETGAVFVFSGSNVTPLGAGCGDGQPPRLTTSVPRIGRTWSLLLQQAEPDAAVALFASASPLAPTPFGTCTFYLDLATTTPFAAARTDPTGVALTVVPMPNSPGLVGQELVVQAGYPARTLPLAFTNGSAARVTE